MQKRELKNRSDIDDLMIRFYRTAMTDETIGYIFQTAELDLNYHHRFLEISGERCFLEATLTEDTDAILC